jgi:hypothetical protein
MRLAELDLTGVDLDDFDAVERRWNDWVRGLFADGYRPADEPQPESTPHRLVYGLVPVGGLNDLSRTAADAA